MVLASQVALTDLFTVQTLPILLRWWKIINDWGSNTFKEQDGAA